MSRESVFSLLHLLLLVSLLIADLPAATPSIFDPKAAPESVVTVKAHRRVLSAHQAPGQVTIPPRRLAKEPPAARISQIIAQEVPGAAELPDGELRVRGADDQFSYYLDGAPLPASVSGSFSDLVNPKDIETLRVYTGGFPAEYGGQLSAIFDVTARAGRRGKPGGLVQQSGGGYGTYVSSMQWGGAEQRLSYFVSGIRTTTDVRLSPLTQMPVHDAGREDVEFAKLDYQAGQNNRVTLDLGSNGALTQIPNTSDIQRENGTFANLIWSQTQGRNALRVAVYSHTSRLRYDGSPSDLIATYEDQTARYLGLRADETVQAGSRHRVKFGLDVSRVSGPQTFLLISPPDTGFAPITDNGRLSGGDKSAYVQDDWTPGRFAINYGLRYDVHQADVTSSQISPRVNLTYAVSGRDTFHVFYDRLFQPIALEDVKSLVGNSALGDNSLLAPLRPERDNFYEVGWEHHQSGTGLTLSAYYKTARDSRDDQTLGNTQIKVPVNDAKASSRGIEFSVDRALSDALSLHVSYSRAWGKNAGPITGGLLGNVFATDYFYDDHDQTHSGTVELSYETKGRYARLDGEYGSGLPFGEIDDASGNPIALNFLRVPPHLTLNFAAGVPLSRRLSLDLTVSNLLNHAYIIKQSDFFSNTQWAQGRAIGLQVTQGF